MQSSLASAICPLGKLCIRFGTYEFNKGSSRPASGIDSCTESIGSMPLIERDGLAHDYLLKRFIGKQRVAFNASHTIKPVIAYRFHSGPVN
jgi:hypothetical protein